MVSGGVGVVVAVVVMVRGQEGGQLIPRQAGEGQLAQVAEHDSCVRALLLAHLWRLRYVRSRSDKLLADLRSTDTKKCTLFRVLY